MGRATGTPKKCVLDGVSYDLMAEVNLNFLRNKYTKEATTTSGQPLIKFLKRNPNIENVDLGCTPSEMENLKDKADQLVEMPIAITLADNSTYRCTGHIDFSGYESETGKITITILPVTDWTPFLS